MLITKIFNKKLSSLITFQFALMLVFLFSACSNDQTVELVPSPDIKEFRLETNDNGEGVHDGASGNIETRNFGTVPQFCLDAWTNPPGCPRCQVHHTDGASFYFYCNGCTMYYEVCATSLIKLTDGSGTFLQTIAQPNILYPYTFTNGYNGTFTISSQVLPFGQEYTSLYLFNCL